MAEEPLRIAALEYHRLPTPGKISVTPTKGLTNQVDLSLAYSPGVAYACTAIVEDPREAATLTSRSNLVAVITNGSAVLGLGNIGALAGKPVMEGKACLFKKFAGIDVFDIEIAESDPEKIVEIVASLEPTFGGINLEDIKSPECFRIETELQRLIDGLERRLADLAPAAEAAASVVRLAISPNAKRTRPAKGQARVRFSAKIAMASLIVKRTAFSIPSKDNRRKTT